MQLPIFSNFDIGVLNGYVVNTILSFLLMNFYIRVGVDLVCAYLFQDVRM